MAGVEMSPVPLANWADAAEPGVPNLRTDDPAKARDAAHQFEALLLGQILRTAREASGGWLGEEDTSGSSATDFAEQQLARVLAEKGGLGLSALIEQGLRPRSTNEPTG